MDLLAIGRYLENRAATTVTIADTAQTGCAIKIAVGVDNQIAIRSGAIFSPAGERMERRLAAIRADLKHCAHVAVAPNRCHAIKIALGIKEQTIHRNRAVTYTG